jgi:hypothetical protein
MLAGADGEAIVPQSTATRPASRLWRQKSIGRPFVVSFALQQTARPPESVGALALSGGWHKQKQFWPPRARCRSWLLPRTNTAANRGSI